MTLDLNELWASICFDFSSWAKFLSQLMSEIYQQLWLDISVMTWSCRSRLEGNQWDNGMVTKYAVPTVIKKLNTRIFKILYITSLLNVYAHVLLLLLTSNWPSDEKTSLWRQTKSMSLGTYISCTVRDLNRFSSVVSVSVWLGHANVVFGSDGMSERYAL